MRRIPAHLSALSGQAQPARAPRGDLVAPGPAGRPSVTSATRRGGLGRRGRRILGPGCGRRGDRRQAEPPAVQLLGGRGPAAGYGAAELDIDPTPWLDVAAAVFGCTPTRWNTPTMARTDHRSRRNHRYPGRHRPAAGMRSWTAVRRRRTRAAAI